MTRVCFRILTAVLGLLLCFAASSQAAHGIGKGDLLSIYVYRQEDMSVKVRVDEAGTIRFPHAGRISVLGKNTHQIEDIIAAALRRKGFASPEVVVSVESFAPRQIFVLGEVRNAAGFSGNIPEGGEMTAMQAVSAAGGLAPGADIGRIAVRREHAKRGVEMIPVPARDILEGRSVSDVRLQPFDTVIVPKALPVSVLGTVKMPGEFFLDPERPLTVSRVIALAGGVERPKSLSMIRVTRGKKSFAVDILKLLEDGEGSGDMTLESGDIVYIPETRW